MNTHNKTHILLNENSLIAFILCIALSGISQSTTGQQVVWKNGVAYTCYDQNLKARILHHNQRKDSLVKNPHIRIEQNIIFDNQIYTTTDIGRKVFYVARGLIKSVHLPKKISIDRITHSLEGLGKVDTIIMPEGVQPDSEDVLSIITNTYPKVLVYPSLNSSNFVQINGNIYSKDKSTLFYLARQNTHTYFYMPYRTTVRSEESVKSYGVDNFVLNNPDITSNGQNDIHPISLLERGVKVYDPFRVLTSAKICAKLFNNYYNHTFMIPKDHPLRKDKSAQSLKILNEHQVPNQSSCKINIIGDGSVYVNTANTSYYAVKDGDQITVPFSSVINIKMQPSEGSRAIGVIYRGDTIPSTEVSNPVHIGLCQMDETVTVYFAEINKLINGIDYAVSPSLSIEKWTFTDAFSDLRSVVELNNAISISKYFKAINPDRVVELILPNTLSSIADSSLLHFGSLSGIAIPNINNSINYYTFTGLHNIDRMYVAGDCTTNHETMLRAFSFGLNSRDKDLRVFVDNDYINSWKFLERLEHVKVVPSMDHATVSLEEPLIGEIIISYNGKVEVLSKSKPSIEIPRFSLCSISYKLPAKYKLEEIRSHGKIRLPSMGYILGEMPIQLRVREAYCKIITPMTTGAKISFENMHGKELNPGDSIQRGDSIRVIIEPSKYTQEKKICINNKRIYSRDTIVQLLNDILVEAEYAPEIAHIKTSLSDKYDFKISPPIPKSGIVNKGDTYYIDIVLKEGCKLNSVTINDIEINLPTTLVIESDIYLQAKTEIERFCISYDNNSNGRLTIRDELNNIVANGQYVNYGTHLQLLYSVSLPECNANLLLNKRIINTKEGEILNHVVTSNCHFSMQYDTLWRCVTFSNDAKKVLKVHATHMKQYKGKLLIMHGDTLYIEPKYGFSELIKGITVNDLSYLNSNLSFPVRNDLELSVDMIQMNQKIHFTTTPSVGGKIHVVDSAGIKYANGGSVPILTRLTINTIPNKGYVLDKLLINNQYIDSVPYTFNIMNSVEIVAEFIKVPCVIYDTHCIDTLRKELTYTLSKEGTIILDNLPIISIGPSAFKENQHINKVIIGNGIRKIKSGAFSGCENLRYVKLSSSIKNIEPNAFTECPSLMGINLEHNSPTELKFSDDAFDDNISQYFFVRVKNGLIKRFKSSKRFNDFNIVNDKVCLHFNSNNRTQLKVVDYSLENKTKIEYIITTPDSVITHGGNIIRIETFETDHEIHYKGAKYIDMCVLQAKQCDSIFITSSNNEINTYVEDKMTVIYPNPSHHYIYINMNSKGKYKIYSLDGMTVQTGNLSEGVNTIDVRILDDGMYLIHTIPDNETQWTKHFIKY